MRARRWCCISSARACRACASARARASARGVRRRARRARLRERPTVARRQQRAAGGALGVDECGYYTRAFLGGDGDGGGAGLARWAHRYFVENLDGGGDPGSEAACGAAAALRAATCGEATGALLAASDVPPADQKLAVAAGRIRTQAWPIADQPTGSPSSDPTHT